MVSDIEISVRVFQTTILAIPIWIAALKYAKSGLVLSIKSDETNDLETLILILIHGGAIAGSFWVLFYASIASGVTMLEISNQVEVAILSIWIFLGVSGFIGITNFTSKVMKGSRLWVDITIIVLFTAAGVGYYLSLL